MEEKLISHQNLISLVSDLLKANHLVIGHDEKSIVWKSIADANEMKINHRYSIQYFI